MPKPLGTRCCWLSGLSPVRLHGRRLDTFPLQAVPTTVLGMARVYYNYVQAGEDGRTPAMRLGLAKGPVKIEDLLYFVDDSALATAAA